MNKIVKIISVLMLVIMLATVTMPVFGIDTKLIDEVDKKPDKPIDASGVTKIAAKIVTLIRNIAVIGAVVLISVLGIKYMMGSVEEKAGYQKSFIPLIVGALVVVAATQIAKMLFSAFS